MQALSGLADFQGFLRNSTGGERLPEMVQDAVFDKTTAMTVKDAVTSALYARDVQKKGGQLIEISLLEAGQSFLWPHAMKGHTFFDGENAMRSIGGHRFGWHAQHVGFSKDAAAGYGKSERRMTAEGRFASEDDEEAEEVSVYATYADPLVGAPITKMAEVHKNSQTIHNGNILERPLYMDGRVVVREPKPAARFMGTPTADPGPAPHLGGDRARVLLGLGYSEAAAGDLAVRGAFSHGGRSRF